MLINFQKRPIKRKEQNIWRALGNLLLLLVWDRPMNQAKTKAILH